MLTRAFHRLINTLSHPYRLLRSLTDPNNHLGAYSYSCYNYYVTSASESKLTLKQRGELDKQIEEYEEVLNDMWSRSPVSADREFGNTNEDFSRWFASVRLNVPSPSLQSSAPALLQSNAPAPSIQSSSPPAKKKMRPSRGIHPTGLDGPELQSGFDQHYCKYLLSETLPFLETS